MNAVPVNYRLRLAPNFRDFTFDGEAEILLRCERPLYSVTLDAADIAVESCAVDAGGKRVQAAFEYDADAESLMVRPGRRVSGEFTLIIKYKGELNERLLGFYRSSYACGSKTKYIATTQFEAADARRAFPCMDRPDCKATFDVSVVAPPGMSAISNMPVESSAEAEGGTEYTFSTTPLMSTYLLYVGVGEFEYLRGSGKVSVVTTKGKSGQGEFALRLAERLISAYEQYFAKSYRLPKLDLVALPDFAAGAMENWGAITFRENLLLYDEENSSTQTKQLVAEVVSHELAHQWFGNLVTMKWWNDLWLNESFATFMATKTLDWMYPSWGLWEQFVNDATGNAMDLDAMKSTHPIDVPVKSPSQIREIFDAISYDKGGFVLRMVENYVGKLAFRDGLRSYIRRFQHQNASGSDLWDCIDEHFGKGSARYAPQPEGSGKGLSVRHVVEPWLKQGGFPVVAVERAGGDTLRLSQERFRVGGQRGSRAALWPVPVSARNRFSVASILMTKKEATLRAPRNFVVNPGRTGFYRVQYGKDILPQIKSMVRKKAISGMDRWAAQNDLFALCVAGRASVPEYLGFVDAFHAEKKYLPLANLGRNLSFLLHMSHGSEWNKMVRGQALPLFSVMVDRLGWGQSPDEAHTDALLRSMALTGLGRLDAAVSERAAGMLDDFLADPARVHPDMRGVVFAAAARRGGARVHSRLAKLFDATESVEEQMRILSGMCEFADPAILRRTLDFSLTDSVRSQNVHTAVIHASANPACRSMLWPWVRERWADIREKVGGGNPLMSRIISGLAMSSDGSEGGEIASFFGENPVPGTERVLEQTLERIQVYDQLRRRAAQDAAGTA